MRETRPRCDAEIGKPGGLWHRCGRAAKVESVRRITLPRTGTSSTYSLWYCSRHAKRATKVEGSIRLIEVHEVYP